MNIKEQPKDKDKRCFADGGGHTCIALRSKNSKGCTPTYCSFYKTRLQFLDGIFKAKTLNKIKGVSEVPPAEYGGDPVEYYNKIWKQVDKGEKIGD